MRIPPPLIIGGGPAGSAAAITLSRAGAKPQLIEATRETGDALCGGFLSWRSLATLGRLGIDTDHLGHPVTRLRLFAGDLTAEARLPGLAIAVSRHRLDALMLAQSANAGARIERGVAAKEIGQIIRLADGHALSPDAVMVATGKHGIRGLERKGEGDPALGLRLRLPRHAALQHLVGDAIELHLFHQGYAGLVMQEDGSANLCMAVRKSLLAQAEAAPAHLLRKLADENPHLGERLGYWDGAVRIDAIGAVPYGWVAHETCERDFLLGDAAACIPSLAGEGMGLAFASGVQSAEFWLNGLNGRAFQTAFAARAAGPVNRALLLWRWAEQPRLARLATRAARLAPWLAQAAARLTRIGD